MSDTRADTTSMGLFLISFILLVFGIVGIFGFQESDQFGGILATTGPMMLLVGILFTFCAYSMYLKDNKFLMIIFGFLGFFSVAFYLLPTLTIGVTAGAYMFFIVVAIFLIVFALWALMAKAGFMLTVLLICAGLVFLFYALVLNGIADNPTTYFLIMGIFAILGFLISIYMALADVTDLNLPVM